MNPAIHFSMHAIDRFLERSETGLMIEEGIGRRHRAAVIMRAMHLRSIELARHSDGRKFELAVDRKTKERIVFVSRPDVSQGYAGRIVVTVMTRDQALNTLGINIEGVEA